MKSDLSEVKVGDTIWTIQGGCEEVLCDDFSEMYPIQTIKNMYTLDGKGCYLDKHPSAFLTNPFEQTQDRVVLVRDNDSQTWIKRVFHIEKNGKFLCWSVSETIEGSLCDYYLENWDQMKELPKLTVEELEEKTGLSADEIREIIG